MRLQKWRILDELLFHKGSFNKFNMITSVRFCLSSDLLNVILSSPKFVYFHEYLHCCNRHRLYDVTCSAESVM